MRDVDRSAGQYFLDKTTDEYSGAPRDTVKIKSIEAASDMLKIEARNRETLECFEFIKNFCNQKDANPNFNAIRDRTGMRIIHSDSEITTRGYLDFCTGPLADMHSHLKFQRMEQIIACPRCGSEIITSLPDQFGVCHSCAKEMDNEAEYRKSLGKLNR